MKIAVTVSGKDAAAEIAETRRIACSIFGYLAHCPEFLFLKRKREVSLGILFVSPEKIKALNKFYRQKNRATDILSFPVFAALGELKAHRGNLLDLGDLVIAPRIVRRDAKQLKKTFYAQFLWVLSHGILHILGLDHERGARERARISELEEKIQALLAA